jgi:hypothetical protein
MTSEVIAAALDLFHHASRSGVMVSHVFVVVLLVLGGAWAAWRGGGLVVRSLARADDPSASLWLIRGIRGVVVGVAAGALASGLLFEQTWLLVFGGIFLAEELYETGVVALILRAGQE